MGELVLVVDDEKEMLASLSRRLELEKIEIRTVESGREALELIGRERINVVVTDIRMPEMSGVELIRAIKDLNPFCNVIVITGYSNMSYAVECISCGAHDYFTKPIADLDTFTKAITDAIERVARWRTGMGFSG